MIPVIEIGTVTYTINVTGLAKNRACGHIKISYSTFSNFDALYHNCVFHASVAMIFSALMKHLVGFTIQVTE